MVSLLSHSSLSLTQYPIDTNAVSWSVDDRIAVSSQEIIKVFSLCRRTSHTSQEPSKLLAAISSTKLPKLCKPSPSVDLRPLLTHYDKIDHSLFLDPAMGHCDIPSDGFVQTKWSPCGLGPTGRCLLTCLTRYGSLLIYAPPTSLEITWKMVCSVSDEYRNLLKATDYNISSITDVQSMSNQLPSTSVPSTSVPSTSVPSTSVPSTSSPSTSVPSTSVPSTSVPSTSVPSTSVPSTSSPSTNVPSTSVPSTSVPLTSSPSTNNDPTGGNKRQMASDIKKTTQQKLLATITSFSWLPVPMTTEPNDTCCLLLAVAVKAGYVILFSFNLNSLGTHSLSPLSIHNLVEDGSNMSTNGLSYWPCALNFITINNVCLLVVSFTNGTLKYFRWDNPGPKPYLGYFTVPCPLNTLWPFADEVPVNLLTHMLNQNGGSNSSVWCIFTKCSHVVIIPINLSTQEITSYGFISGCHNDMITGLTLISNNILTCSRDGQIQTTCIPAGSLSGDSHVTIDGYHVTDLSLCAMEVPQSGSFKFPHGYNGMAASQNGLFIALGISFSSYNKLAMPSEIQLLSVCNSELCPFPLPSDYNMCWDSYEYHRFNQLFLNLDTSCSDLRLQLYHQQLNEDDVCDEPLLDVAIIVKFVEDMLEKLESNKFTLSKQCKLSISNFYTLLCHHEINTSNRVRDPAHSFYCNQIPQWSAIEYCGICNEVIPYSCYRGDSCTQGHYWKRCVLTQCLITLPFEGVCCSLCESHAYSIKSSSVEEGTWLSWLLRNNRRCPLCGGFFDLFVNACN